MKIFYGSLVLFLGLSYSLLGQQTEISFQIEGKLSGKDFIQTSFVDKGYQYTEEIKGVIEVDLERPSQILFLHLKNNGKVLGRKTFWIGQGNYLISGNINDIPSLQIEPIHPYDELSRQIAGAETSLQKSLILENLDKEVGLNWLMKKSNAFSEEELEIALSQVSEDLQSFNSFKRFVAQLSLKQENYIAKEGDLARDFNLESREGEMVSLSDYDRRYRLLEFSFSGCKPCLDALPEIKSIHEQYGNQLSVMSIWNDNSKKIWLNAAKKHKEMITWTDLWDETGYVTDLYQISIWPTYILISPEGQIEQIWKGYIKGRITKRVESLFSKPIP
ncbi:TlpA family protein disulfide reductase [Algoriphagus algorifonticola]|uniref:TlpA family protein disulfide reductase n=1 Tax=Algoriphagus algorifonticola TaxID=2593007 RepID=UPI0011A4EACB|nr:TlpA disulfide reductase family protein [Algoriphagus algorifonticola]